MRSSWKSVNEDVGIHVIRPVIMDVSMHSLGGHVRRFNECLVYLLCVLHCTLCETAARRFCHAFVVFDCVVGSLVPS